MTEDQLEQEVLGWLSEVGYAKLYDLCIAPNSENPELTDYRQVFWGG
jgi:type I restriction enzyme R subunit